MNLKAANLVQPDYLHSHRVAAVDQVSLTICGLPDDVVLGQSIGARGAQRERVGVAVHCEPWVSSIFRAGVRLQYNVNMSVTAVMKLVKLFISEG